MFTQAKIPTLPPLPRSSPVPIREDTHKKNVFFSGQTSGNPLPPTTKQKTSKICCFSKKNGKIRKNCQNPFQAIIRLKKERKKSGMDH